MYESIAGPGGDCSAPDMSRSEGDSKSMKGAFADAMRESDEPGRGGDRSRMAKSDNMSSSGCGNDRGDATEGSRSKSDSAGKSDCGDQTAGRSGDSGDSSTRKPGSSNANTGSGCGSSSGSQGGDGPRKAGGDSPVTGRGQGSGEPGGPVATEGPVQEELMDGDIKINSKDAAAAAELASTVEQMIENDPDFAALVDDLIERDGEIVMTAKQLEGGVAGWGTVGGKGVSIDSQQTENEDTIAHELLHNAGLGHGQDMDQQTATMIDEK